MCDHIEAHQYHESAVTSSILPTHFGFRRRRCRRCLCSAETPPRAPARVRASQFRHLVRVTCACTGRITERKWRPRTIEPLCSIPRLYGVFYYFGLGVSVPYRISAKTKMVSLFPLPPFPLPSSLFTCDRNYVFLRQSRSSKREFMITWAPQHRHPYMHDTPDLDPRPRGKRETSRRSDIVQINRLNGSY